MEANTMLFTDETLDGFKDQNTGEAANFEIIKFDSSCDSNSLEPEPSISKRKRNDINTPQNVEKRHKSVKEENKNFKFEGLHCELEMKKELKKQQFTKNFASEVSVSESCSLFNNVTLSWKLAISSASFVKVHDDPELFRQTDPKNGLWFRMNNQKKGKDIVMLIELYETNLHPDPSKMDQLVQFCDRKCGQKRNQVIEAQDLDISPNQKGIFETSITVNEQCAHRSDNDYGAPHTRFYFTLKFFDRSDVVNGQMQPFSMAVSNQLKVVAPGKAKAAPAPKKGIVTRKSTANLPLVTKGAKLTVQQTMETIVMALEKFDERISSIENSQAAVERLDQLEQRVAELENKLMGLPELLQQMIERTMRDAIEMPSTMLEDVKEFDVVDPNIYLTQ